MDRLAAALGLDPLELRLLNALEPGDPLPTGQVLDGPAPGASCSRSSARSRCRPRAPADPRALPGGAANVTRGEGVRRGIGYALGVKNVGFSEGFDDYSTATVRVARPRRARASRCTRPPRRSGRGSYLLGQIARSELGLADVVLLDADTSSAPAARRRRRVRAG